jgi:phosphatidate cytidylyltransferase
MEAATEVAQQAVQRAWLNLPTYTLLGVVLAVLAISTLVARYLDHQSIPSVQPAMLKRFMLRLRAWWMMCVALVLGLMLHRVGTVILFLLLSFWALREFITMTPTRRGDHRALFLSLVIFTPLQYLLIALGSTGLEYPVGRPIDFYGLYSIMIPVYASVIIPAWIAFSNDHKRFLDRAAQIQAGLMVCVYSLSYAPALLYLDLKTSAGVDWKGSNAGFLFYFVLISQLADVLQWTWGRFAGKNVIAPSVSGSRTWEGLIGGALSTGIFGALLSWATPFQMWEAAILSMIVAIMGCAGGMTMSAIKRDRGVNDYGTLVMGHAGVLDRIDTLCFAAPVFYHLTRFFFSQ